MTNCRLSLLALSLALGCSRPSQEPRPGQAARAPAPERASLSQHDNASPRSSTPYIPPQCYTKTTDASGRVHNPCFTCHADAAPPNYIRDGALQLSYDFGPPARVNPWTNLFVDRSAAVQAISDAQMLAYVREDNYRRLRERLATTKAWDVDGDGRFGGYVPDVAFHFDERGFDRDKSGGYTGFRAYAYYPLPGTFFPTNGSFGDAVIRLPHAFREALDGQFDRTVYETNLAMLEALITRRDVAIEPTDEARMGVDLDGDGKKARAHKVRYRWKPGGGGMHWAGRAGVLQASGAVQLSAGLFPEGTEIAHSVRYLDVQDGRVLPAARMKELRYMVKAAWLSYGTLEMQAVDEAAEKASSPDKTRALVGSGERGIGNRAGWRLQAFIEDRAGELRPQTLEEHGFCIGCHSGVGVTDDSVFSFGRKLSSTHFQRGWYHPSQRGLEGVPEPVRRDGQGEYTYYLTVNGAGDELRENDEARQRFFDVHGNLRDDMAARVRADVTTLLLPSAARALLLDKAYRVIVGEQSFTRGRDATVLPVRTVHRELSEEDALSTGVAEPIVDRRRVPSREAQRSVSRSMHPNGQTLDPG